MRRGPAAARPEGAWLRVSGVDASPTLIGHARMRTRAATIASRMLPRCHSRRFLRGRYRVHVAAGRRRPGRGRDEIARVLVAGGRACVAVVHPINSAGHFEDHRPDAPFVIRDSYLGTPLLRRRRTRRPAHDVQQLSPTAAGLVGSLSCRRAAHGAMVEIPDRHRSAWRAMAARSALPPPSRVEGRGHESRVRPLVLVIGIVLVVIGGLAALGVRLPFGRLPGDIAIEGEQGAIYIPIASMIVISSSSRPRQLLPAPLAENARRGPTARSRLRRGTGAQTRCLGSHVPRSGG